MATLPMRAFDDRRLLVIVDGHAIAFHSWFSSGKTSVGPGFFQMLSDMVERHAPSHVIVTFDPPPPTFQV